LHAANFEIYILFGYIILSPMKFGFLAFKKGYCQQVNHVLTSVGKLSNLKCQMWRVEFEVQAWHPFCEIKLPTEELDLRTSLQGKYHNFKGFLFDVGSDLLGQWARLFWRIIN